MKAKKLTKNKQLLDEVEQNIVICQWRAISYLPMPSVYHSYYFFRRFDWPKELQITAYK